MFLQNRELWNIIAFKREEVMGGWKRLHCEGLHRFYASPNMIRVRKSRRMRLWIVKDTWGTWEMHKTTWLEKLKGRERTCKARFRWEDNFRINLRKIVWEVVYWMHLAQDKYRTPQWKLMLHEGRGIFWHAGWLLASEEGLSSTDLFSSLFC
jgi:hypothetical protein